MQTSTGWTDKDGASAVPPTHATWQPIETAPKGGVRVLLYRAEWAEDQCIGFWSSDFGVWQIVGVGTPFLDATHWAPLPRNP